jgi:hypothetical protein
MTHAFKLIWSSKWLAVSATTARIFPEAWATRATTASYLRMWLSRGRVGVECSIAAEAAAKAATARASAALAVNLPSFVLQAVQTRAATTDGERREGNGHHH